MSDPRLPVVLAAIGRAQKEAADRGWAGAEAQAHVVIAIMDAVQGMTAGNAADADDNAAPGDTE